MHHPSRDRRRTPILGALLPLAAIALIAPASCGLDAKGNAFDSSEGAGGAASAGSGISTNNSVGAGGDASSASGSGGSGASTGAGGSGGTPMPMPENCLDSIDNDLDGMIDCADPDCSPGFECVAAPPAGWTLVRPIKTEYMPPTDDICPDQSSPHVLFRGPDDGACTACSCTPNQTECKPPELSCWIKNGTPDCTGGPTFTFAPTDESCTVASDYPSGSEKVGCKITKPSGVFAGTACPPGKTDIVNKNPFGGELHVCDLPPSGAGCAAGLACVPVGDATFNKVCISKEGKDDCPAPFADGSLGFASGTDERSCTQCDCSGVSLTCANTGKVEVWDEPNCQASMLDFGQGTACTEVTSQFDSNTATLHAHNTPQLQKSGSCTGGMPAGNGVVTTGPQKICCQ